jgi:cysteine-rich repeat protein
VNDVKHPQPAQNGSRAARIFILALFLLTACDSPPASGGTGGVGGAVGSGGVASTGGKAGASGGGPVTRISTDQFAVQLPAGTTGAGGTTGASGSSGSAASAGSAGSPVAQCFPTSPSGSPPSPPVCGDGFRGADEPCDDGNQLAGDGCSELCQITPQLVSLRVRALGVVTRINAGGGVAGTFGVDSLVTDGFTYSSSNAVSTSGVANAAPEEVYQSEHYGEFFYTFSGLSPAVRYTLRLHFAEIFHQSVGDRVFNVAINGTPVLENFDIVAVAGPNQAVVHEFSPVADSSGQIVVSFTTVVDQAKVSGLELIPPPSQGTLATEAVTQINVGGDEQGSFGADQFVTGGSTYANSNVITTSGVAHAAPAAVYQSERYGSFSYDLSGLSPSAMYIVRLHFAEIYYDTEGSRVFDVTINGTPVLESFDIVRVAGPNTAVVRDFSTFATAEGQIVVSLWGVIDLAKLSGLELLRPVDQGNASLPGRSIGVGRHPLAAGCNELAVAFSEQGNESAALYLSTFKSAGQPLGSVQVAQTKVSTPDPSVAALPGDDFVVAWTDFDDDELGIFLRKVGGGLTQGESVVANEDSAFSQSASDIVFDGSNLVVAWVDSQDPINGPDLRYRLFTPDLKPLTGDQVLVATGAVEDNVVLAGRNGHWAAAWRAGSQGKETIEVQSGSLHWTVGPFLAGAAQDRPDLIFLDETHLAVAFTMGTDPDNTGVANVPRLHAAVLDPATPGLTESFALLPAQEPYAALPSVGQSQPNLVLAADHLLVAWRSSALPDDGKGAELWSRRVPFSVNGNSITLDASHIEVPVVQNAVLRDGDQGAFRMVGTTLWPSGGIATAWDDSSRSFGATAGGTDVAVQFWPDFAETSPPAAQDVPFELSADGHYYDVNVLRRGPGFPEPTATVTFANGASQYLRPPSAAFDGDDVGAVFGGGDPSVGSPWVENPNASSTIVIDLGRVVSIGAIRPIYGITGRAPDSMQFRVAETSGQWATVVPPYLTDRTTVVTPLALTHEFPAIRARYLELTQTGTSTLGMVDLQELLVFPSAAQDPPPTTQDGYDITYLSSVTHSQNANMSASDPRTLFDKNFYSHLTGKTLAQGANGDAIVTIDLGGWFAISQVSMMYYYGYNWLLGGRIEVASHPAAWNVVVDSGRGSPLGTPEGPQTFTFTRQTARYVRLTSYFVPGVGLNVPGWNIPTMLEVQVF